MRVRPVGENLREMEESAGPIDEIDWAPRVRRRNNPLPDDVADAMERTSAVPVESILTTFGSRVFASMADFQKAWDEYEAANFLRYRTRHSVSASAANEAKEREREENRRPRDPTFLRSLIPSDVGYAVVVKRCTHGCFQEPRGTGARIAGSTRFKSCDARITGYASQQSSGEWVVLTKNEVVRHNHRCTQVVFDSYTTSALVEDTGMFTEVRGMVQASAPARNICDVVGMRTGLALNAQQLANFRRGRLGGQEAVENLRLLLKRFASFSGSQCLIIDDQDGQVCGIVLQFAAQRAMFERWGDSLILDWTHNTNNIGYYLGSLMITSVTGRGVSVADFLCVEQTKAMMRAVLAHFIRTNAGADRRVLSIVIDKDYKEWSVLEELFPIARVLLCQFHVLKWFGHVVTMRKYNLSMKIRDRVLAIVTTMVYARTISAFQLQQQQLEDLLEETSPSFLTYMQDRWYSCRPMWSNCERATVFTAMNTTSNRIESSWNQLKKMLGRKLRIDLCAEAIFAYQTAVMRREYKLINDYNSRVVLRTQSGPFMSWAMAEVSQYCADEVAKQWRAYVNNEADYVAVPVPVADESEESEESGAQEGKTYSVWKLTPESSTYEVDTATWKCTCDFSVTSALPCRHQIYVARDILRLGRFPVSAITPRWNMQSATSLLPRLREMTADIQSLRTGLLLAEEAFDQFVEPDNFDLDDGVRAVPRRVAHVRLRRNEQSSCVVLNQLEKRNIVRAEFEEVSKYLMAQSTPDFKALACELREMLAAKLLSWTKKRGGQPVAENDGADTGDSTAEAGVADEAEDIAEFLATMADAMKLDDSKFSDADDNQRRAKAAKESAEAFELEEKPSASQCPVASESGLAEYLQYSSFEAAIPSNSSDASSVPTSAVSEALKPVVAHALRPNATAQWMASSIGSSETSEIMDSVAAFQLKTNNSARATARLLPRSDGSTLANASGRKPLKAAPRSSRYIDAMRDILGSDDDILDEAMEDEAEPGDSTGCDDNKKRPSSSLRDDDDGRIKRFTMHIRKPQVGSTKKLKGAGGVIGHRLAYVVQTSTCPVTLHQFVSALERLPNIALVREELQHFPVLFQESCLTRMAATASLQSIARSTFSLNFAIPSAVVTKLDSAVKEAKSRAASQPMIDLASPTITKVYVARLASEVRGFTEDNIADLKAFYRLMRWQTSYASDVQWLRNSAKSVYDDFGSQKIFPYNRGHTGTDGLLHVHEAALAAMDSSSFRSRFQIRGHPAGSMSITLAEVIGFVARDARLSDAVMMYALKAPVCGSFAVAASQHAATVIRRQSVVHLPLRRANMLPP